MNRNILFVLLSVLFCCSSILASAQLNDLTSAEKKYYNEHPEKILPDAKKSFTRSEYLQTQKLCRFHSIVLMDEQKSERTKIWDDAKACATLSAEMITLKEDGKMKGAKLKAEALLKINPKDVAAKEVMAMPIPEPKPESTPEPAPTPTPAPKPETTLVSEVQPVSTPNQASVKKVGPRTRFAVKAGDTLLREVYGYTALCPSLDFALYDLGGSPIGFDIGAYYDLEDRGIGFDLSFVLRLAKKFYINAGVGTITYSKYDYDELYNRNYNEINRTWGCAPIVGLSYIIGKHFCVSASARYMPDVYVHYTTFEHGYKYYSVEQVLCKSVAPTLTIGWAF